MTATGLPAGRGLPPSALSSGPGTIAFLVVGALIAGLVVGSLAVISLVFALGLLAAGMMFVVIFLRPHTGAYVYLALTPLVVGINRGAIFPVLRPSEALLVLIVFAVAARGLLRLLQGERLVLTTSRFDLALIAVVMSGSVISLGWMAARGIRPSVDDILHAMVFWKYLALYWVVRTTIKTEAHVRTCVKIVLAVSAVVATVGALQAVGFPPVANLLATYYPPNYNAHLALANRGTSTIAHSIAMGDVMAMSLAMTLAALIHRQGRRTVLVALAILFLVGGVGSGQFSGVIALFIALVTVGVVTGRLGKLYVAGVPAFAATAVLLAPVVLRRLSGFGSTEEGLPPSWVGRLDNLSTRVWPKLFSDFNFVFGVRTSSRIPAWERWRDFVYIESGHSWLLWVGGIPLLLAFFYFSWIALRATARVARRRVDMIGVAATGAATGAVILVVLTLLDNHLTLRGTADLLFPLLALAFVAAPHDRPAPGATPIHEGAGRGKVAPIAPT